MYFYFMIKYWQMEIKKLSFLKFHAGPFLKHPAKKDHLHLFCIVSDLLQKFKTKFSKYIFII
ncbi:hypothetical protein B4096_0295 [Heyndrickxia coagulans]|uniref:Uncharacterized protein n=1 Tax=Heyndrickxia coagulans TaxID=1398 RepID=A0A150JUL8_HEYCO|nr:hypothetical protein B4098_0317 [Heyndrickxia coagulans]KYC68259.1 hypothetical protein B4096_0295 [Heyndrickxia coagulans]